MFCDSQGKPWHHNYIRLKFFRLLKRAAVRQVRFHDLRHSFASILLQNAESPVYVKDQLGYSSIVTTVDLFRHLIPGGNRQAVDRLDTPADKRLLEGDSATSAQPGRQMSGATSRNPPNYPQVTRKGAGVDDGFRTRDLRIHNPAL